MSEVLMEEREVTQEDLDNDPDLVEMGIKVGEVIELPALEDEEEAVEETVAPKKVEVDQSLPEWMRA